VSEVAVRQEYSCTGGLVLLAIMSGTAFRSAVTGMFSGAFQGATGVGGSIIMVTVLSSKWGLKLPQVGNTLSHVHYL
jgi:hypothetical protein